MLKLKTRHHCVGQVMNVQSATPCHQCKTLMVEGEIGVEIVRTKQGFTFHPKCFVRLTFGPFPLTLLRTLHGKVGRQALWGGCLSGAVRFSSCGLLIDPVTVFCRSARSATNFSSGSTRLWRRISFTAAGTTTTSLKRGARRATRASWRPISLRPRGRAGTQSTFAAKAVTSIWLANDTYVLILAHFQVLFWGLEGPLSIAWRNSMRV